MNTVLDNDINEQFTNIIIEKALLGYLMINNDVFDEIANIIIDSSVFYYPLHQKIYTVVADILNKGGSADSITVSSYSIKKDFDDLTFEYINSLTYNIISTNQKSYSAYAKELNDLYLKRAILYYRDKINSYLETSLNIDDILAQLERDIFNLSDKGMLENNSIKYSDLLNKTLQVIDINRKKQGIIGITTGLRDLDNVLGGLQNSDLIILAGRPSMGKTALATNIAFNAAYKFAETQQEPGAPVVIFSLEMSAEQVTSRIMASQLGINNEKLRKGNINDDEFVQINQYLANNKDIPIFIDDTPSLDINKLKTRCRLLKRKYNIGLVIIDYIQLILPAEKSSQENRTAEISSISRNLKAIAKELNVPIIALSQLSRAVEAREDKKPLLSDLRESGSIEQDADIVAFIFREEYYVSRAEPQMAKNEEEYQKKLIEWKIRYEEVKDKATIIIAKNRHGRIGNIDIQFVQELTQFKDLAPKYLRAQ